MATSALYTYQRLESTIDFEGHIAILFFTRGCNFQCLFCHNPELIPYREGGMTYSELGSVLDRARQNWVDGVCITGGEPTMQPEIVETAKFIKLRGFDLKLDTQGSFPDRFREVMPFCDFIAMDYKSPIETYASITQVNPRGNDIRRSLEMLMRGKVDYEIRITIVPGIHTEDDMRAIGQELHGVKRFVLQTFIPRDNLPSKALRTAAKTPRPLLERYAEICRDHFAEVVIR
ncbi:MAG: anaerobic ribonucleoside-triphosphate reductase activating protein [Candidatus Delongbacteria bacterium]|nr:anaerobic ribonucleoside-triphosphate reductase activating protein [Candidatus Delongbacteria bacterium]